MVGLLDAEMRTEIKMKMWVPAKTRGMRVPIAPTINNLEMKEEEEKDIEKVHEEEVSMVHFPTTTKKTIKPMSTLNAKE